MTERPYTVRGNRKKRERQPEILRPGEARCEHEWEAEDDHYGRGIIRRCVFCRCTTLTRHKDAS